MFILKKGTLRANIDFAFYYFYSTNISAFEFIYCMLYIEFFNIMIEICYFVEHCSLCLNFY